MARIARLIAALVFVSCITPANARSAASPSILLDPTSPTLATIGADAGELLNPGVPPGPGPLPLPIRSVTLAALGLVAAFGASRLTHFVSKESKA